MGQRRQRGTARTKRRLPGRWSGRIPNLATLERRTLPQRAAAIIRRRILDGRVRPGGRLEPIRGIAQELGISLPTVRQAIAQLQGEGLVEVRHGIGCFVVRRPRTSRVFKATARRATRREIGELRVVVDPAVAGIAARRGTPARIGDLVSARWEREAARRAGDPDAFVDADMAFHTCVAAAARGPIGIAAHRLASVVLRPDLRARAAEQAADDELADLHRALAEAIGERQASRAVRVARAIARIETRPP